MPSPALFVTVGLDRCVTVSLCHCNAVLLCCCVTSVQRKAREAMVKRMKAIRKVSWGKGCYAVMYCTVLNMLYCTYCTVRTGQYVLDCELYI